MGHVERRIELAFQFLADVLEDPSLLDKMPDRALGGLGDAGDPELRTESAELLKKATAEANLPSG